MKFVIGLATASALIGATPTARAQQSLPPEKEPPVLVPLPATPALPAGPALPRFHTIPVRNRPASFLAWQLDPEHNPPPAGLLAQFGRDAKAGADESPTPRLDGLAKVPVRIDMRARWMQIDDETLTKELPQWKELGDGNWARVLPLAERETIEVLVALGKIAPLTQQIAVFDKQPATISYSLVRPVIELEPSLREVPRLRPTPVPDKDGIFADPPYIPNIAQAIPMLPYMAPMPGAGIEDDLLSTTPPSSPGNPTMRMVPGGVEFMVGSRFQLTPSLETENDFTLTLRKLDGLPQPVSARVASGGTVVFALPNILSVGADKVRRTFLLVEPRGAPLVPIPMAPANSGGPAPIVPSDKPVSPAEIPRLPTP